MKAAQASSLHEKNKHIEQEISNNTVVDRDGAVKVVVFSGEERGDQWPGSRVISAQSEGKLIGAIGVSGDSSCTDHNIAWKVRHRLKLNYVPAGVSPTKDDNIINDIFNGVSASGWGHPQCSPEAASIAREFPQTHPVNRR